MVRTPLVCRVFVPASSPTRSHLTGTPHLQTPEYLSRIPLPLLAGSLLLPATPASSFALRPRPLLLLTSLPPERYEPYRGLSTTSGLRTALGESSPPGVVVAHCCTCILPGISFTIPLNLPPCFAASFSPRQSGHSAPIPLETVPAGTPFGDL